MDSSGIQHFEDVTRSEPGCDARGILLDPHSMKQIPEDISRSLQEHHRSELVGRVIQSMGSWALDHCSLRRPRTATTKLFDRLLDLVTDTEPDRSLRSSERFPTPVYRLDLFAGPISPRRRWNELARARLLWPRNARLLSRELGLGTGVLPSWNRALFQKTRVRGVSGPKLRSGSALQLSRSSPSDSGLYEVGAETSYPAASRYPSRYVS